MVRRIETRAKREERLRAEAERKRLEAKALEDLLKETKTVTIKVRIPRARGQNIQIPPNAWTPLTPVPGSEEFLPSGLNIPETTDDYEDVDDESDEDNYIDSGDAFPIWMRPDYGYYRERRLAYTHSARYHRAANDLDEPERMSLKIESTTNTNKDDGMSHIHTVVFVVILAGIIATVIFL